MNPEGQAQLSFGQATGRLSFCSACRKPLPRPQNNELVLVCSFCRTETILPPPLVPTDDKTLRVDLLAGESVDARQSNSAIPCSTLERRIDTNDSGDDFELKLEPESERISPTSSIGGWQSDSQTISRLSPVPEHLTSAGSLVATELDPESRSEQAKHLYNESSGLYPRERHYPTLEAMQRLYKLFGYAAVLLVFPYIGFRFLSLLVTTKENHLQVLAEFSEFAVPMLFGCVALTASLFAASEGIRLAMDIQDNTLRTANSFGRRRN